MFHPAISSEGSASRRRDDFTAPVKTLLAQRVGYLCSHPDCQRLTIGPKKGEHGANNIGVAAHIKAAALGGPRYDENQTPSERSSLDNGIWLCADHAHLIDHDPKEFPVEKLQAWKRDAEERAFQQLATGQGAATIQPQLDELLDELAELRSHLALPQDADLANVREKVRAGSLAQVEVFEATARWPKHAVELELAVEDGVTLNDQSRFGQVLTAVQRIVLVSAPGTGKTTSLIQIARKLIECGPVPVFVPLGEWAASRNDLFRWIVGRRGYAGLSSNHLKFLSYHGELALLLDGWNEVPSDARHRLIMELKGLERDFPLLKIVMSSRRTVVNAPLPGRQLTVLPPSRDQQMAIARAMRGEDGISVLDATRRTSGLRELVKVPLYLRSLMETGTSDKLPETKEEVLRRMVEAHEVAPENAELFHRVLDGRQQKYLTDIALAAQETGSPTISEDSVLFAVVSTGKQFVSDSLLSAPPNASQVIDILVSNHLLIRESDGVYAFQHQQLQEWYASLGFEGRLLAGAGDLAFDHPLVVNVLNDQDWAEVILFACERMSRKDAPSAEIVAKVVDLLLGIDPLFAAQVISRSGPMVWDSVGGRVIRFARAWHTPGQLDRAVGFMIASRQPEFADIVWPLVSNDKQQTQLRAMRLVRRFNPAVLGDRLVRNYAALPENSRGTITSEFVFHGDTDAIDAALKLALSETSVAVRHGVFEALTFLNATRQLENLLRASGEDLAQAIAQRGHLDGIRDPALLADLTARRAALATTEASPETRLAQALASLPDSDAAAVVLRELKDPVFSVGGQGQGRQLMHEAWTRFPQEVAVALQWRVENGHDLPFRPRAYLEAAAPTDDDPIAALTLVGEDTQKPSPAPYLAGPRTVRELIQKFLDAVRKYHADGIRTAAAYAPVRLLEGRLESTRASVLFDALQEFAEGLSPLEISALAEIVSRHGRGVDGENLQIPPAVVPSVVKLIDGWGNQLTAQSASRHDMSQLTWAMRRVPDASQVTILSQMLEADLAGLRAARAAFRANKSDQNARSEIQVSYVHDYRIMLTAIGTEEAENVLRRHLCDPEFSREAAVGLQVIWQQRHEPVPKDNSSHWPDFARAAANRSRDRSQTCDTAELLMAAARTFREEGGPENLTRSAWFAGCAVLLPHGDRAEEFREILGGDLPTRVHCELAQRMVVGGLIVPSGVILNGLAVAIAEQGDLKWIQDNDLARLFDWVELLPMSDQPTAMLDGLDMIGAKFDFSKRRVKDLLGSVRYLEEAQRIDLLRGIATRYPDQTNQYELFLALKNPGELTLDFLLEIAAGRYGSKPIEGVARFDYPDELYRTLSPEARDGLAARFAVARDESEKAFLAKTLLTSADHEVFLKLSRDEVGRRVIRELGWSTLSSILYIHQPISLEASSYELIPRDLTTLRKGLFGLTRSADPATANFAKNYLEQIDAERDREGGFSSDPRHPDISSGFPWPDVSIGENAAL